VSPGTIEQLGEIATEHSIMHCGKAFQRMHGLGERYLSTLVWYSLIKDLVQSIARNVVRRAVWIEIIQYLEVTYSTFPWSPPHLTTSHVPHVPSWLATDITVAVTRGAVQGSLRYLTAVLIINSGLLAVPRGSFLESPSPL
jgi:hypothetical protein